MELTIIVAVIIVAAYLIFKKSGPSALEILDVNKDGKVDVSDVKAAADVNKDGKVDADDAKAVVKKTKTAVKNKTTKRNKPNGTRTQR